MKNCNDTYSRPAGITYTFGVEQNGTSGPWQEFTVESKLETNGNGNVNAGENDWQGYNSPNGLAGGNGLQVSTPAHID